MLKENNLKKNDVVSFKLTSGEEVISRFEEMENDEYIVTGPMVLVAGSQGLGMQPFMLSVKPDDRFALNSAHILCVKRTEEQLAKQFISQTSGLVL